MVPISHLNLHYSPTIHISSTQLFAWTSNGYAPFTPVCRTGVFLIKLAAHYFQPSSLPYCGTAPRTLLNTLPFYLDEILCYASNNKCVFSLSGSLFFYTRLKVPFTVVTYYPYDKVDLVSKVHFILAIGKRTFLNKNLTVTFLFLLSDKFRRGTILSEEVFFYEVSSLKNIIEKESYINDKTIISKLLSQ